MTLRLLKTVIQAIQLSPFCRQFRAVGLVPLVRRIAGDRLYSLPVARCIVYERRGHCQHDDVLHGPAGRRRPPGKGTP
jgi:hypothetical protein